MIIITISLSLILKLDRVNHITGTSKPASRVVSQYPSVIQSNPSAEIKGNDL